MKLFELFNTAPKYIFVKLNPNKKARRYRLDIILYIINATRSKIKRFIAVFITVTIFLVRSIGYCTDALDKVRTARARQLASDHES